MGHSQMGGGGRRAPRQPLARGHRLPHGALHRRTPAQPARHSGHRLYLLFQEDAEGDRMGRGQSHADSGRHPALHQQHRHSLYRSGGRRRGPLVRQRARTAGQQRTADLRPAAHHAGCRCRLSHLPERDGGMEHHTALPGRHPDRLQQLRIGGYPRRGESADEQQQPRHRLWSALFPQPRPIRLRTAADGGPVLHSRCPHRRREVRQEILPRHGGQIPRYRKRGGLYLSGRVRHPLSPHVVHQPLPHRRVQTVEPDGQREDGLLQGRALRSPHRRPEPALLLQLPDELHVLALLPVELRGQAERQPVLRRNHRRTVALRHRPHRPALPRPAERATLGDGRQQGAQQILLPPLHSRHHRSDLPAQPRPEELHRGDVALRHDGHRAGLLLQPDPVRTA